MLTLYKRHVYRYPSLSHPLYIFWLENNAAPWPFLWVMPNGVKDLHQQYNIFIVSTDIHMFQIRQKSPQPKSCWCKTYEISHNMQIHSYDFNHIAYFLFFGWVTSALHQGFTFLPRNKGDRKKDAWRVFCWFFSTPLCRPPLWKIPEK